MNTTPARRWGLDMYVAGITAREVCLAQPMFNSSLLTHVVLLCAESIGTMLSQPQHGTFHIG